MADKIGFTVHFYVLWETQQLEYKVSLKDCPTLSLFFLKNDKKYIHVKLDKNIMW